MSAENGVPLHKLEEQGSRDTRLEASHDLESEHIKQTNRQLLTPVDDIVKTHRSFRSLAQKLTGRQSFKKTNDALQQEVNSYLDPDMHDLRQEASAAIGGAVWAHRDYEASRRHGRGKVGRTAQVFIASFANFLNAYSGVIEVVKKAGQPYGEVAYECLSILFVVVIHKSNNDQKMAELLDRMAKSFPQMDVYLAVYRTRPITVAVIEVYRHVIGFARMVTHYFMSFKTRLLSSIGQPPSLGIEPILATIHGSLSELSAQAMVLLHQRNYEIQNKVNATHEELSTMAKKNTFLQNTLEILVDEVQRLKVDNKEMKQAQERQAIIDAEQKLESLKGLLKADHPVKEADTALCGDVLTKAFNTGQSPIRRRSKATYGRMTEDLLDSCPVFTDWRDSSKSSLLVYSGKTWPESRNAGYTHSWISKAAVTVVESLRSNNQHAVFFSCNSDARADRYSLREIFVSTMLQLLHLRPLILRNKYEQLRSFADGHDGNSHKSSPAFLESCRTVFEEILSELGQPVTIVFDRIEQCDWKLSELMECLVNIVTNDGYHVKVMVVLDPSGGHWNETGHWDMESCLTRVERREMAEARVLARLDWNQEKRMA